MPSSLAKELSRLNKPAPRSFDPESEGLWEESSRPEKTQPVVEEYDSDTATPKGRLLRSINIDDEKYEGKKASRADLGFQSEESTGFESEFGSEEESEEVADKVTKHRNTLRSNSTELNKDRRSRSSSESSMEEDEEDEEDDEKPSFEIRAKKKVGGVKQAEHAKIQIDNWSKAVGLRIRMQPLITAAERLPEFETRKKLMGIKKVKTKLDQVSKSLRDVIGDLLSLRDHVEEQNMKDFEGYSETIGKKRSSKAAMLSNERTFKKKKGLSEDLYCPLNENVNVIFDRWHTKVKMRSLSKLKMVDQSISKQVNEVMETNRWKSDKENYNDDNFYQQLLKDLVTFSGVDVAREQGGSNFLLKSRKLTKKKKANVDVKASKGRRIRYTVHDKLVSFLAPQPVPTSTIEREQLLKSLFA
mmetsp:Transcript_1878/g.2149  ORF Transcript_1878/g.2149 Transcript_1878/m.2149 type:complete len:415 (-) Transcript_1878:98-1342(-)